MKKVAAAISTLVYLLTGAMAYAQTPFKVLITPPTAGVNPETPLKVIISNVVTIIFSLAAFIVLIMLIIGAFNWITSGGDKEKIQKSRDRIINALIGLALLALAFLIVRVVAQLVNVDLLNLTIPALGPGAGTPVPTRAPNEL